MKKILAMILCVVMLATAIPTAAFADGIDLPPDDFEENPFTDVPEGQWYTDGVLFCYNTGLMTGTSATTFEPNTAFTRAMFVTVLYRIDGSEPLDDYDVESGKFTDVKPSDWFAPYVAWAVANEYTSGTSATTFGPETPVTRETIAQFFYNYTNKIGFHADETDDLADFTDASSVSSWALDAVKWAVAASLISGTSATTVSPRGTATRAQVALITMNYVNYLYSQLGGAEFEYPASDTLRVFNAENVDKVVVAKGAVYDPDELGAAESAEYTMPEDGELTVAGLYGAHTAFAFNKYGECVDADYHVFSNTGEYPIGSLKLGETDIADFAIIYGRTEVFDEKESDAVNNAKEIATTLASYIEKATGAKLTVAADTAVAASEGAHEILIGRTNREDAGYVTVDRTGLKGDACFYKMDGNYLVIASNEKFAGTCFAMYNFLRNELTYTFFANEIEALAGADSIVVPDGTCCNDESYSEYSINYQLDGGNKSVSASETSMRFVTLVHTLPSYADPNYDGTYEFQCKEKVNGEYRYMMADPCLTDSNNLNNIVRSVKLLIEKNNMTDPETDRKLIWLCQSDGESYCKCDYCRLMYSAFGRPSTYTWMMSYVSKIIDAEYPNSGIKLVGTAYKYTIDAPKFTELDDAKYAKLVSDWNNLNARGESYAASHTIVPTQNIVPADNAVLCICTDTTCSSHELGDPNCEKNAKFNENCQKWANIYKHFYIWDYINGDPYPHSPFPNIYEIYNHYQYFTDLGVNGFYMQGGSRYADFSELRTYIVGRLSWNPNISLTEFKLMVNNFLAAAYGDGWMFVRNYIDEVEQLSSANDWAVWNRCNWNVVVSEDVWRENYEILDYLWDDALNAAQKTGTEYQKMMVKASSIQIRYIGVRLAYEAYKQASDADKPAALNDFVSVNKAYKALMDEVRGYFIDRYGLSPEKTDVYAMPVNWTETGDPENWRQSD